jgi:hypothetical protein
MMTDHTPKFPLFCIALALRGLLVRPAFPPITAKAEGSSGAQLPIA